MSAEVCKPVMAPAVSVHYTLLDTTKEGMCMVANYPDPKLYIAGEWRQADGQPVINPADESPRHRATRDTGGPG